MTFNEIEKEFDEKFVNTLYSTQSDVQVNVWKLIDYGNGEHKIGHYYGPDEIKSFLKQSFIKYLQGEVERLEKSKKEEKDTFSTYCECDGECFAECSKSYNQAISDQITYYKTQIKELEV